MVDVGFLRRGRTAGGLAVSAVGPSAGPMWLIIRGTMPHDEIAIKSCKNLTATRFADGYYLVSPGRKNIIAIFSSNTSVFCIVGGAVSIGDCSAAIFSNYLEPGN